MPEKHFLVQTVVAVLSVERKSHEQTGMAG